MTGFNPHRLWARTAIALLCAGFLHNAHALFEDGEARRAILELRQRVDALQAGQQRSNDDNAQLRRAVLELQNQIESQRMEMATLRGQNEQLMRDVADLQRRQKDIAKGIDERLRQFEPVKVVEDGLEFMAEPEEKRQYDAALALYRSSKFVEANSAFAAFIKTYPRSGFVPSARFWLGNAQYANTDYKDAIVHFKALLSEMPKHARAPEAALSIANCQIELRDTKAARKTLEDLLRTYPQSEAAAAAKERLSRLGR